MLSRDEFFALAGLKTTENDYTPVSVGRRNKVSNSDRTWMKSLRNVNFTNADELKALSPERVYDGDVIIPVERINEEGVAYIDQTPQKRYKAIIGEVSKQTYAIKSNMYHAVQHTDILDAFAQASQDTGIPVFGRMTERSGRMNAMVFFADPSMGVEFNDLGPHTFMGRENQEAFALGVRVYNSHDGTTGFGGSAIAVRRLCTNLMAVGETLGDAHWKHYTKMGEVTTAFSHLIEGYMNQIPVLADRIHELQEEVFTLDEAECALWGISLEPVNIRSIMSNLNGLNQEIEGGASQITGWDLYNASTAFYSHRTAGDTMTETNISSSNRIEKFMLENGDKLVSIGEDRKRRWEEAQEKRLAQNQFFRAGVTVVGD